jgi:hypothetical protein
LYIRHQILHIKDVIVKQMKQMKTSKSASKSALKSASNNRITYTNAPNPEGTVTSVANDTDNHGAPTMNENASKLSSQTRSEWGWGGRSVAWGAVGGVGVEGPVQLAVA